VTGFALSMLGMIGIAYGPWTANPGVLSLLPMFGIVMGWAAATLGRDVFAEAFLLQFQQPIYWLGQAVFVAGTGIPLILSVAERGWTEFNMLGGCAAGVLFVIGLGLGAHNARMQRKKKSSWPH
jgi:hypothetical protein